MYSPGVRACSSAAIFLCPGLAFFVLERGVGAGTRQSSANQYDSMHSTIDASNAGQTTPGTIRAASTSMATESAIFTNPHHSMLTALTTGDSDDSRLVAPRAISAPGTTTTAAP